MDTPPLTVGELRKLIADLHDDALVLPDWADGPPSDEDPAVSIEGLKIGYGDNGAPYLGVLVDIAYLDEFSDPDPDDDEFDDEFDEFCPICSATPCMCGGDEFDDDDDDDDDERASV